MLSVYLSGKSSSTSTSACMHFVISYSESLQNIDPKRGMDDHTIQLTGEVLMASDNDNSARARYYYPALRALVDEWEVR